MDQKKEERKLKRIGEKKEEKGEKNRRDKR